MLDSPVENLADCSQGPVGYDRSIAIDDVVGSRIHVGFSDQADVALAPHLDEFTFQESLGLRPAFVLPLGIGLDEGVDELVDGMRITTQIGAGGRRVFAYLRRPAKPPERPDGRL